MRKVNWSTRSLELATVSYWLVPPFGKGTNWFNRSKAVGSKHWAGMAFLGKMAAYFAPAAMGAPPSAATAAEQPVRPFRVEATLALVTVPAKAGPAEKSPCLSP